MSPAGNPAIEVWGGINMAQPRIGAAAREVLEGFVAQERSVKGGGFIDMVISRFGKAENLEHSNSTTAQSETSWAPSGLPFSLWPASTSPSPAPSRTQSPGRPPSLLPLAFTPEPKPSAREITASDGCILPGTGHLQPAALRDISTWACNLYLWHEDKITPSTRTRRGKRSKPGRPMPPPNHTSGAQPSPPTLRGRKSIVSAPITENEHMGELDLIMPRSPSSGPIQMQTTDGVTGTTPKTPNTIATSISNELNLTTMNPTSSNTKFLNLLTFGWARGGGSSIVHERRGRGRGQNTQNTVATESSVESHSQPGSPTKLKADMKKSQHPRFLYGYLGDLDNDDDDDDDDELDTTFYPDRPERISSGKITEKTVWLPDNLCSLASEDIELNGTLRLDESIGQTIYDRTLQSQTLKPFRMVVYLVRRQVPSLSLG